MSATETFESHFDLERYPLCRPDSRSYEKMIGAVRRKLNIDGCAVLSGSIKSESIELFVGEANHTAQYGHRSFSRTNAYFGKDDPTLDPAHPIRRFYDRSNSFVPADNFGSDSLFRQLYEWPAFTSFVQSALNEKHFYRYADPLADVIINVVEEGEGFPWHFDTNNYTVTLAIQNGDEGGVFEYAPNLRTPTDENYEAVRAILDGDHTRIHQLHLNPGDLQIFKGRYALHRVSPVRSTKRRYVGIFSFVEQPGMVAKVERAKQLYGRALPIHYERENQRLDELLD